MVFDSINADGSHTLILLSREEISATKSNVKEKAKAYSEDGMTGWEIPGEDLAKRLRDTYGIDAKDDPTARTALNVALGSYSTIKYRDRDGYIRYICGNANYTFAFIQGSPILNISPNSTYKVRFVKTITR